MSPLVTRRLRGDPRKRKGPSHLCILEGPGRGTIALSLATDATSITKKIMTSIMSMTKMITTTATKTALKYLASEVHDGVR